MIGNTFRLSLPKFRLYLLRTLMILIYVGVGPPMGYCCRPTSELGGLSYTSNLGTAENLGKLC